MKKTKLIAMTRKSIKYLLLFLTVLCSVSLKAAEYRVNQQETSEQFWGIYGIEYNYNNTTRVMGTLTDGIFVTNKADVGSFDESKKILYKQSYIYNFINMNFF